MHCKKVRAAVEIGDLHYFTGPARVLPAPLPLHPHATRLLAAGAGALLWIAVLLANIGASD